MLQTIQKNRPVYPLHFFAYHKTVKSSLGFSPFQLLYGRWPIGPQDILKEQWEAAPTALRQNRPTVELLQVRPRIEKLMKEAQQNGRQAASQQKKLYGRRKKPCELKVGDEVLVLPPAGDHKPTIWWQGPFKVLRKIERVIYEIEKPEAMKKYKVLPINLLRRFKRRLPENLMTAVDRNLNAFERVNGGDSGVCSGLCESETHLGEKGEEELLSLLQDFWETFSGTPGRTNIVKHQIDTGELRSLR